MGRLILKWIFKKQDVKEWVGCIWLRIWSTSGYTQKKGGKYLEQRSDYHVIQKDSAPWN
jgi:hypothetical protein